MADKIKTRILIISDTHGRSPQTRGLGNGEGYDTDTQLSDKPLRRTATGFRFPLPPADVLLHCGDLTLNSRLDEYEDTFDAIRAAPAKLKLVIAGNHDLSLDEDYCKMYGDIMEKRGKAKKAEVEKVIEDARKDGVVYLEEGSHEFDLENGAKIKVYGSAWTPVFGGWAFQYETEDSYGGPAADVGHNFKIPEGVDVAMTHGPPRWVLDHAGMMGDTRAGCDWLFDSVRKARPRIHCFGHIHEAWGAYLARWKEDGREGEHKRKPESIDEQASKDIMNLAMFWPKKGDERAEWTSKMDFVKSISKKRGIEIDTTEGNNKLETGGHTLFINAAIMDMHYRPVQAPWLVDIDLSPSKDIHG